MDFYTGFGEYPLTDPIIVADANATGATEGQDSTWIQQKSLFAPLRPEIANLPSGSLPVQSGVDPILSMPLNVLGSPGNIVHVPMTVGARTNDFTGFNVTVNYDTTYLDLPSGLDAGGITLAGVFGPGSGWSVVTFVDDATGSLGMSFSRTGNDPITADGQIVDVAFSVSPLAPVGLIPLDVTGVANDPPFSFTYNDGSILIDAIGPKVEAVIIDSTAWTNDFRDYLDGGLDDAGAADFGLDDGLGDKKRGYVVPTGAGQLTTMPWSNINRIKVTFTEDVAATISASDFSLVLSPGYISANGMSAATLPGINAGSFAYDGATKTASFELTGPLQSTAFELKIAAAGVQDAAGNNLDGEWTTSQPSFPSGAGGPGGNFSFLMLSLPGDAVDNWGVDGYGLVSANDSVDVRNRQNEYAVVGFAPSAGYNPRADFDGNGIINASDSLIVRDAQNAFIAPPPAVVASFAVSAASAQPVSAESVGGGQLVVFVPTVTVAVVTTSTSTPAFTGVTSQNVDDALALLIDQQQSTSDDDDTVIENEIASDSSSWDQAIEELLAEDAVLDLAFDWKS